MANFSKLTEAVEQFLGASEKTRKAAFQDLVAGIRSALAAGRVDEATAAVRCAVVPSLDYTSFQSLYLWHSLNLTWPCSAKMSHPFTVER